MISPAGIIVNIETFKSVFQGVFVGSAKMAGSPSTIGAGVWKIPSTIVFQIP